MTLSPARTFRAALWRVSSADRSPNCKTGLAGGGRRELPLNKHVESVSNQFKDVGSTPTASTNSRVAGVAPVSLVQWADLHRYSDTCRLSGATAGRDRQLASPAWRPMKDGGSNTTAPTSEELAPRCSPDFGIDCRRYGSLPMRAGTNVKSPATFAVSTPDGRGHKQDWQPGSIPDSYTTRANSGRLRLVQSRNQARPDCNPSPSRFQPSFDCDVSSPSPTIHLHTHP